MKHFTWISILLIVISCTTKESTEYELFGETLKPDGAEKLTTIQQSLKDNDTTSVKLIGIIDEVCQSKGCWMKLKTDDGSSVRVTFKDYGFFVPKDAKGRTVILEGNAVRKNLDIETAQHYAEDAGRELTEEDDLMELSIVAAGVLIEKSDQL